VALRIVLAPSARDELAEIWSYIAADSPDAADLAIERIVEGLDRLVLFPRSGRPRNELAQGLRSYFIMPRHTVYYRIVDDRIEVAHVIHHARDVSKVFPPDRERD